MTTIEKAEKYIYHPEHIAMAMVRLPKSLAPILACLLLVISGCSIGAGSGIHNEGPSEFSQGETDKTTCNDSGVVLATHDNETGNWTIRLATTAPSPRFAPAMAYDEKSSSIILFGGKDKTGYRNDTWKYDWVSDSWTELKPIGIPALPSSRSGHSMVYDDNNSEIVMFGGWTGEKTISNETWVYFPANNTWIQKYPSSYPSGRAAYGMSYDTDHGLTVMFGGSDLSNNAVSDTWVYDLGGNTWTNMSPLSAPSPRWGPGMAFDKIGKKIVLFSGGYQGLVEPYEIRDTWSYDYPTNNWTEMLPEVLPAERAFHQMVFNNRLGEILLFGGVTHPQIFVRNDTWSYNLSSNVWTYRITNCSPPSTYGFTMTYDTAHNATVIFGGYDSNLQICPNETWSHIFNGYESAGNFVSRQFDTGGQAFFGSITWDAVVPPSTSIKFQMRAANSSSELVSQPFVGPEGTTGSFYVENGQNIFSGHNGTRWLQYKAILNTTYPLVTPVLRNVSFSFNLMHNLTLSYPTGGENLSGVKQIRWIATDPDNDTLAFDLILIKGINTIQLASNLSGDIRDFTWNTSEFASGNYRLRIIARDVNSSIPLETEATSAVFKVYNAPPPPPNNPPWVELMTPETGALFDATTVGFEWQGGDDDGDALRYKFHVATAAFANDSLPPPSFTTSLTSYSMSDLVPGTTYYWTVIATDGRDNSTVPETRRFSIRMPQPENHPPSVVLVSPSDGSVLNNTTIALSWSASDPDGDGLSCSVFYSQTPFDSWTLPTANAKVSGTTFAIPGIVNGTTLWWTVVASDGKAESTVGTIWKFTVNIALGNRPPTFTAQPPLSAQAGSSYEYSPTVMDEDGDALYYSLVTKPEGMSLNPATGKLSWTPRPKQAGNHPVLLRMNDSKGGFAEQTFTINVVVTLPTCMIQYPSDGTLVRSDIVIRGTAGKGVADLWKVEIRIDGGAWMTATGTVNWSYQLDTRTLAVGLHRIEARALEPELESEISVVELNIERENIIAAGESIPLWQAGIALVMVVLVSCLIAYALWRRWSSKK